MSEGVDRDGPHAGRGRPGGRRRPATGDRRRGRAGDHHDLTQPVVALDGDDPVGQGGLELRTVAEDEHAVLVG